MRVLFSTPLNEALGGMNDSAPLVIARGPREFAESEVADFTALVLAGGEVTPRGLKGRILRAKQIAFLREGPCLLGVAGLKNPTANHRREVGMGARVSLDSSTFPLELGWVFVLPSARGRKLSFPLCDSLMKAAGSNGVFSTSRACNVGMHRTLAKLGFVREGAEWHAQQNDGDLVLFCHAFCVRKSSPSLPLPLSLVV